MRKDVTIRATPAVAFDRALKENIMHHCPLCKHAFNWSAFQAHAKDCIKAHPEKVRQIQGKEE